MSCPIDLKQKLPLIEKVPYELWDAILKVACARDVSLIQDLPPESTPARSFHIDLTSLRVSHVCETWRAIALSNPSFWTDVCLNSKLSPSTSYPNVNLTALYIERSATQPLHIDIDIMSLRKPINHDILGFILRKLFRVETVERWRTVKLGFNFRDGDHFRWQEYTSTVFKTPLLESIELHIIPRDRTPANGLLPSRLWMWAPLLTEFFVSVGSINNRNRERDFDDRIFPYWSISNQVPYNQLVHLVLDGGESGKLTWFEINRIISTSCRLVSCFLAGIINAEQSEHDNADCYLSTTIQHLHLQAAMNFPDDLAIGLVSNLRAPSLQTLSFVTTSVDWEPLALVDFIQGSECALTVTELSIYHPGATSPLENLIDILRLLPKLQIFRVDSDHLDSVSTEFAEAISQWDADANEFVLCPNLKQLSFEGKTSPFPNVRLADILKTRLSPPISQSPAAFTEIAIHSKARRKVNRDENIQTLCRNPYSLQIIDNDLVLDKRAFWTRHARSK